jgi:hypothetical protein
VGASLVDRKQQRLFEQARSLYRSGAHGPAEEAYGKALQIQPPNAGGWAEFGGFMLLLNRVEEAGEACRKALRIDPLNSLAQLNSAQVWMRLGRLNEAEEMCWQALSSRPGAIEVSLALSECLIKKGELPRAREVIEDLLKREPEHLAARNKLSELFYRLGRWDELRKEMERRLERFTGITTALDRACLNLRFGDMPLGWDQYEARWQVPDYATQQLHFTQPRWGGETFVGKTLLLYWEQGFGDTLMFVRYAPLVKARGGRVLLVAQARVANLVATCPGLDEVIVHGDPIPPFDLHLPLMSLPGVFRTNLESIPGDIPYLHAPAQVPHRAAIAEALCGSAGKTRIGLVWAGNTTHRNDAKRSVPAKAFSALAELPDTEWFSFQVGREEAPPLSDITDLEPLLEDFSDTAFALHGMDLVISVDTAVAHLAGAMGIPTLLLLPTLPDWRWMMGRPDSPWYPTMRIYRQSVGEDWRSVIQRIYSDLTPDV